MGTGLRRGKPSPANHLKNLKQAQIGNRIIDPVGHLSRFEQTLPGQLAQMCRSTGLRTTERP